MGTYFSLCYECMARNCNEVILFNVNTDCNNRGGEANEYQIYFKIVLHISLPGLATIALFATLTYWNDWWLPLLYITEPQKYNLQYLLQSMISNIQNLTENSAQMGSANLLANVPKEGARMALCIIATLPILFVYPFFQKYFIQGLTVGSVKE